MTRTSTPLDGAAIQNADPHEISKFSALASSWWDPQGELKTLHHINPVRLNYIEKFTGGLLNKKVVDIGCGGGILSESMASKGANVTAIDASQESLEVARLHQIQTRSTVNYLQATAEVFAEDHAGQFDIVTCMELLEHVPDPESVIAASARLLKPGGMVYFSTLNRTLKAYTFAVLGAEYVMSLLPKGTHNYARFIKPSELAYWIRQHKLMLLDLSGMHYNPISQHASLSDNIDVNYLICAQCTDD